jgi:hypothetical protein
MGTKSIKRAIKKSTYNTPIWNIIYLAYSELFLREGKQRKESFGTKNADKTIYIIKVDSKITGLCGIVYQVLNELKWAYDNNYIAYVDMKNGTNQYSDFRIEGVDNPWEIFFEQLSELSMDDVYHSKNVIISGWNFKTVLWGGKYGKRNLMLEGYDYKDYIDYYHDIFKNIKLSDYIKKYADEHLKAMIGENTLGILVRGTDMTSTRPVGHFIQPSVDMVIAKVNEFQSKYKIDSVFLVTEDNSIEEQISNHLELPVKFISQDIFKDYDYDKQQYLSEYLKGSNTLDNTCIYFAKLIGLTKCKYMISSITTGSIFANMLNDNRWVDSYYFNIGKY